MVLTRTKRKNRTHDSYTLDELFRKNSSGHSQTETNTTDYDEELQLAIQLSREEHVDEQRRLLEQFSQLSQRIMTDPRNAASTSKPKNARLIPTTVPDDDDDDQWFQTISSRPQPRYAIKEKPRTTSKRKSSSNDSGRKESTTEKERTRTKRKAKEKETVVKEENDVVFDIDDVSDWLQVKDEEEGNSYNNKEDNLVIDDLTAFLNDDDEEEESSNMFEKERLEMAIENDNASIVSLNSDSEYSLIDLVNDPLEEEVQQEKEDNNDNNEDDGYLSPLEGFVNIKENRDNNEEFNPYFEQLQPKPKKSRRKKATTTTTTATSTKKYKKRWFRKKRKS
ncbi:MAG: hypothetical protein EXX96DRAFT_556585 [Benjaminiella poitrasii]|nr:MAG: hypothetical protein EXX96DRAFT_556585 [Benjaminiella poitrasii]